MKVYGNRHINTAGIKVMGATKHVSNAVKKQNAFHAMRNGITEIGRKLGEWAESQGITDSEGRPISADTIVRYIDDLQAQGVYDQEGQNAFVSDVAQWLSGSNPEIRYVFERKLDALFKEDEATSL